MAGMFSKTQERHHNLAAPVSQREDKSIDQLLITPRNFTNPFKEEGEEQFNLVTKVIMPEKVKDDLYQQSDIGRALLESFIKDRIHSKKVNVWFPMTKRKLNAYVERQRKSTESI